MLEYEVYHAHTCLSNRSNWPDSAVFIKDYAEEFRRRGQKVLCLSEHGNRSDVWQQFDICEKFKQEGYEMTPIAAAEAYYVPDRLAVDQEGKRDDRHFHLILVAKNMNGYYQLNEALSEANISGFYRYPRVDLDILSKVNYKDFICTTACIGGIVKDDNFERLACELHEVFRENFYLEIQHHPQKAQVEANMKILRLYGKYRWPLIYATDSHYIKREDKIIRQELLMSKRKGVMENDDDFELFLPTAQEAFDMLEQQGVFVKARIEEAMENTLVLREFEGVHFTKEKKIPNSYPDLALDRRNYLYKKLCCDSYIQKAGMPTKEEAKEIHEEMDAVADTNTADYFLIAKKVIDKGIENGGIITKTGRGSGSSFCTNFALGFTSLNRLHSPVKLYPERFISRERMASGILPDLDINLTNVEAFEKAGKEILGEYGCMPMIKYDTAKTLAAFKLLAKARDLDFETSNAVSKQIQNYEQDVKHAIENNADDPEYNVDDDVSIESYVEDQYLDLINDSKQYKKVILTRSPHPCAHILLDRDLRREVGVVRLKGDLLAANIDGGTADAYGYLKLDFLTVTVVELISSVFKEIGIPMMDVGELLAKTEGDNNVWSLYANGFTQCLNQCEQPKSTQRVMRYKPKNIVELAAFVGAIRPGFKNMLETFISRTPFSYNIKSLDALLATKEIKDSFLLYDEQVLSILISAGINASDAYVCLKGIKKKKYDKVEAYKERFREGFARHLQEDEHATEQEAKKVVDNVWGIIESSASYLFNASHALCVACDSLYGAYLKAYYPYEFYLTALKIYDRKKNTDKISAIISEMKRYKGIQLLAGKWGQDNRSWFVDKQNRTISQSLSSIRYMSKGVAEDLYALSQQNEVEIGIEYTKAKLNKAGKIKYKELINSETDQTEAIKELFNTDEYLEVKESQTPTKVKFDCFTNVLRAIQMATCLDTRQIKILIELGYFEEFGKSAKLMKVYNEFFEGENKITKSIKSFNTRLDAVRKFESELQDNDLPIRERLRSEQENVGLCLSLNPNENSNDYFVRAVDEKWGTTITLYNIRDGVSCNVRFRKADLEKLPVVPNQVIKLIEGNSSPRYTYKGGKRTPIPGEKEYWVKRYVIV